jgi:hypothetical protein
VFHIASILSNDLIPESFCVHNNNYSIKTLRHMTERPLSTSSWQLLPLKYYFIVG